MTEANRLSAAQAIAQLSSGALTAEALTCACLDRAAERASVKAWIWPYPVQSLGQARAADRARRPGLLAGLPIAVKDIIDTADVPTGHGSPISARRCWPSSTAPEKARSRSPTPTAERWRPTRVSRLQR